MPNRKKRAEHKTGCGFSTDPGGIATIWLGNVEDTRTPSLGV